MEERQEHLSQAQVELCASLGPGDAPKEMEAHLSGCGICLQRLLNWQRNQFQRFEMASMKPEPNPGCPTDSEVRDVAAGMVPTEATEAILRHAAHCNHCGPLLGQYLQIFSEESSPEIEALIDQSPSSRPGWEREKAREIVRQMHPPVFAPSWWSPFLRPRFLTAAAGLAALVIGGFLAEPYVMAAWQLKKATSLTAAAASQRRASEMRCSCSPSDQYPGAYHGHEGTMGSSSQSDEPPWQWDEALSMVKKRADSGNLSSKWLNLQRQLLVLEDPGANNERTKQSFHDAQSASRNDPGLRIDLAVRYFEEDLRAASLDQAASKDKLLHPPALTRSIELLNQALHQSGLTPEQRRVALFNLAIAFEKSAQLDKAIEAWKEYLEADPSGGWHDEAGERLKEDKDKTRKSSEHISFDPAFFLAHLDEPAVQNNIEEYLERATISWLPDALDHPDGISAQAVRALAEQLKKKHSDSLLSDLLARTRPADLPALLALSAAMQANREDNPPAAKQSALEASRLFSKNHNLAGEAWADFEEVYADQRDLSGQACVDKATILDQRLAGASYQWLQGEITLERAICRNFTEVPKDSDIDADLDKSRLQAAKFGFPILNLRFVGLSPGIKRQQELICDQTIWSQELEGVQEYRQGVYPRERLFQFYSVLEQCTEQEGYWNAAEDLMKSMIAMRLSMEKQDQDLNVVVALYLHLAGIRTSLRNSAGAEEAIRKAETVFNNAETTNQPFKASTRILLAESQLQIGKVETALKTLEPVQIEKVKNYRVVLDFRRVKGAILLRLNRLPKAQDEYQSGIVCAESSLSGVTGALLRANWASKTEPLYRGLTEIWLKQNKAEDAWKLWEWSKARGILSQSSVAARRPSPTSWTALQKAILAFPVPSDASVRLVYAVFGDRLHVWTVGNGKVRSTWIEVKRGQLETLIDNFVTQCANPKSPLQQLQADGRELFSLLLGPFAADLNGAQTMTLEMDQRLWRLPVQALTTPSGLYVTEQYYVGYSPGVLAEQSLRKPGSRERQNALLQVEAYPGSDGSLADVSKRFRSPTVFQGDTTDRDAILKAMPRSNVFFFFGHALAFGRVVTLRINDKSSLRAADFTPAATAHLSLAVLAACSTGSGEEYGPLDTDSLVRALLASGVSDVVASQWDVYSPNTRDIVKSFFHSRSLGQSPTRAMTHAQREFLLSHAQKARLASEKDERHPYYWAGFMVIGRQGFAPPAKKVTIR